MISLDRDSGTSVRQQMVQQLRYHIASGTFSVGDTLPSTRDMAEQTGTSFHTVRDAYQELQELDLVESRRGSGYVVVSSGTLSKSERMEQGADIVRDTVKKLIGLGMSENEMEYLYQEQLSLLQLDRRTYKLLMVAPFAELAARCGKLLTKALQESVTPTSLDELSGHADADLIFSTYPLIKDVQSSLPRADVIGVSPQLEGHALDRVARLLDHETLGLVVKQRATIPHLTDWIKRETGFTGQVMATSLEEGQDAITRYARSMDYIVCLSGVEARVQRTLESDYQIYTIDFRLSEASLEQARASLPGR